MCGRARGRVCNVEALEAFIGGVTTYVQKESPGASKEPNWLPAPDEQFLMILRTYLPAEDIGN